MSLFSRPEWPHRDTPAPAAVAGEKDACGVGFLASLKGEASHWVLRQALRGLDCMEHRGGCGGDGDSAEDDPPAIAQGKRHCHQLRLVTEFCDENDAETQKYCGKQDLLLRSV